MDKRFVPELVESSLYQFWEKGKFFQSRIDSSKKPFCIILPPPNANGSLHLGHAMFTYEDVMIRYNLLKGNIAYWQLGLDHAGFETQYVFEKYLKKQGKSRFDYDRETLFRMIWEFVMVSKENIKSQMKRLGFALDWTREKFTMDKDIVAIVYKTFNDLHKQGLVYRAYRLVNYCTSCGTSFSDLEVNYEERIDPLYYMKYGPFTLATVRPETKFGDTAVAVHPRDKRYREWIGKEIEVVGLLGKFKMKVVGDEAVDPKFGTGVVKVTPAHDFTDYEIAERHDLAMKQVIGSDGRLSGETGLYKGMKVSEARKKVVEDLQRRGLIVKIKEDYKHRVGTCYRCGRVLEPLPKEQWFVKIKPLAEKAIELVREDKINVYPKRFKKQLLYILDNFIDWNISRQIVWGIRIPAYRCTRDKKWFVSTEAPRTCKICGECKFEQDPDTFDTWFSSAQWPYATLMTQGKDFYDYFYPTSVMETGHDILRAWVARMIMIGYFATKKIPFETVFLHGMVRDKKGQKMSKSKGNVIDPLEMVNKYGADAFRASLLFGIKEGADVPLSDDKIIGMRNFANKVWNIGRFIHMNLPKAGATDSVKEERSDGKTESVESEVNQELEKELVQIKKKYLKYMDGYKFSQALGLVYEFLWHRFADYYIEALKEELRNGNMEVLEILKKVYFESLKMLHPFMPFVTEAAWKVFHGEESSILKVT